jgi:N-acetylneuraminate synthase|tara:strand:+ start:216 stop:377 length:162 start_codon:yes stop_codon:yes gene_type:complete
MKKVDVLNENNLQVVWLGLGLPTQYYDILLGRKINWDVKKGTVVKWDLIGQKE